MPNDDLYNPLPNRDSSASLPGPLAGGIIPPNNNIMPDSSEYAQQLAQAESQRAALELAGLGGVPAGAFTQFNNPQQRSQSAGNDTEITDNANVGPGGVSQHSLYGSISRLNEHIFTLGIQSMSADSSNLKEFFGPINDYKANNGTHFATAQRYALPDNEDPIYWSFNIDIDMHPDETLGHINPLTTVNSPLFRMGRHAGGLGEFLLRYSRHVPGMAQRQLLYEKFCALTIEVFKSNENGWSTKGRPYMKNHYLHAIKGLDKLLEHGTRSFASEWTDSPESKITFMMHEDSRMYATAMREYYQALIRDDSRMVSMIPENLLEFDMYIQFTEMRNMTSLRMIQEAYEQFARGDLSATQFDEDYAVRELRRNVSCVIYKLHGCQFRFKKAKSWGDEIKVGGFDFNPTRGSDMEFDISFKSVTRRFRPSLLDPGVQIDTQYPDLALSLSKVEGKSADADRKQTELNDVRSGLTQAESDLNKVNSDLEKAQADLEKAQADKQAKLNNLQNNPALNSQYQAYLNETKCQDASGNPKPCPDSGNYNDPSLCYPCKEKLYNKALSDFRKQQAENTQNPTPEQGKTLHPTKGKGRITSTYMAPNRRDANGNPNHFGIDIGLASGSDIVSIADGTVVRADMRDANGYGNFIIVQHASLGYSSCYAHLSQIIVSNGQSVKAGDIIGKSGGGPNDPGRGASSGAHLHFEIRKNPFANATQENTIDPLTVISNATSTPAPANNKPQNALDAITAGANNAAAASSAKNTAGTSLPTDEPKPPTKPRNPLEEEDAAVKKAQDNVNRLNAEKNRLSKNIDSAKDREAQLSAQGKEEEDLPQKPMTERESNLTTYGTKYQFEIRDKGINWKIRNDDKVGGPGRAPYSFTEPSPSVYNKPSWNRIPSKPAKKTATTYIPGDTLSGDTSINDPLRGVNQAPKNQTTNKDTKGLSGFLGRIRDKAKKEANILSKGLQSTISPEAILKRGESRLNSITGEIERKLTAPLSQARGSILRTANQAATDLLNRAFNPAERALAEAGLIRPRNQRDSPGFKPITPFKGKMENVYYKLDDTLEELRNLGLPFRGRRPR